MRWIKRILRPEPDVPPPLMDLTLPAGEDRRALLDETHLNIRHRERVLRALEARARVRGGAYDHDHDH